MYGWKKISFNCVYSSVSKQNYLDVLGRGKDKFLHPKDLSSFLFQYEISRKPELSENLEMKSKSIRSIWKTNRLSSLASNEHAVGYSETNSLLVEYLFQVIFGKNHPNHFYCTFHLLCAPMSTMAICVVEFSNGEYKVRKFFALESIHSKEINEFWELD